MEFFKQEYWSELPYPPPGDFPDIGIEPRSPELQADSLQTESLGKPHLWTENFQTYKLDLEKAEEIEIKLPMYAGA